MPLSQFCTPSPIFRLLRGCAWLLMTLPMLAQAELVPNLYEVVLPVADESAEVRNAAMADGLAEMLVRQSGDGQILQKITPPNAGAYVKQYRYEARPAQASAENNGTTENQQIRLQYNSTRIMDFLRSNGLPIWGDHRAVAVLWLAVRDGRNQYLLKASDSSLFKDQLEKLFKQRGIPVVWPSYDKRDQALIKFTDVWAGFSEPLQQASARYSQGPVLSGNLSWNGSVWSGDWTLLDARHSQRWSLRSTDYEQLLSDAVTQMADALGKQYAVLESNDGSTESRVQLDIENVSTLAAYVRVKKYLASLQAVQNVQLTRLSGDQIEFSIALRSRVDDLLNLLATSSQLKAVVKPKPPVVATTVAQTATPTEAAASAQPPVATLASRRYSYRLVN